MVGAIKKSAVGKLLQNEAGVSVQMILAGGTVYSGPMVMLPCEKTDLVLSLKFGADATFLGVSVASPSKTVKLQEWHHINPAIEHCKTSV